MTWPTYLPTYAYSSAVAACRVRHRHLIHSNRTGRVSFIHASRCIIFTLTFSLSNSNVPVLFLALEDYEDWGGTHASQPVALLEGGGASCLQRCKAAELSPKPTEPSSNPTVCSLHPFSPFISFTPSNATAQDFHCVRNSWMCTLARPFAGSLGSGLELRS